MTIETASGRRRRRTPDVLRQEALDAAHRVLVQGGPAAVTLQAIAGEMKLAHGTLTHHFGTIANLQAMLVDRLVAEILDAVRTGVSDLRRGLIDEVALIDMIFDRFEESGAGRLFGWLAAQRDPHLASLFAQFRSLLVDLEAPARGRAVLGAAELPGVIARIVNAAFAASLIGDPLGAALGLPARFTRDGLAADLRAERRVARPPRIVRG